MKLNRKTYTTRNEKIGDWVIGFVGWFVINLVMTIGFGIAVSGITAFLVSMSDTNGIVSSAMMIASVILNFLPLVLNGAALLFFTFTRHWIAFGMLAAFGVSLLIVLCLTLLVAGVCFAALGGLAMPGQ